MLNFIQRQNLRIALLKRLDKHEIDSFYFELGITPDVGKTREESLAILLGLVCNQKRFDELRVLLLELYPELVQEFEFLQERAAVVEALPVRENPYRGLAAFQEVDAARFFGRKAFCSRLKRVVVAQPFTALTGASGSGKSSAVFAGLFPRLSEDDYLYGGFRPLTQPFVELRNVLAGLCERHQVAVSAEELAAVARGEAAAFQRVLSALIASREDGLLVLYADQFEELFTLNADHAADFVQLLQAGFAVPEFHLLVGFRADFLPQMISHFAGLLDVQDQQVLRVLPAMSAEDLQAAIVEPAAALGVSFDAALVQQMIAELGDESGRLPLLQFALTQLWEGLAAEQSVLDFAAYAKVGGLTQALVRHADAVYEELSAKYGEAQLRHVFTQLVSLGAGTADTRRVATAQQVQDWALVKQLADSDARLVVTGESAGQPTVEVVHEALIQHWQPLRKWLAADREFLSWQGQLRADQARWAEHEQDELLLQGWVLDEAVEKLKLYGERSSDVDWAFVKKSLVVRYQALEDKLRWMEERSLFRRHSLWIVGTSLVLSMMLLGITVLSWQVSKKNVSIIEMNGKNVEKVEEKLTTFFRNQSSMLSGFAELALEKGQLATAMRLALEALPKSSETYPDRPFVETAYDLLSKAMNQHYQGVFQHEDLISPDNSRIVTASSDNTAHIWINGTLEEMIEQAKCFLPPRDISEEGEPPKLLAGHLLTCEERKRYFLEEIPRCQQK